MIFPSVLKKGDTIGITATSSGLSEEKDIKKLENAINNLNDIGYKVIETDNVRKSETINVSLDMSLFIVFRLIKILKEVSISVLKILLFIFFYPP